MTSQTNLSREELQALIDALRPKAETGAQWAEICWLENQMLAAPEAWEDDLIVRTAQS